ncbi:hypothetical protein [Paracoccus sp. SCSIO 75233]|uniref:hypothetical protein n=1 Tax=Paracoccus sp. SCSIO 75233 TaxID=3017782 RepID=UPI0022F08C42|nr:hypothetical protein [Paracoccus sp. SCSIO 75233]WBU54559.1 hypothetical protein PAF12_06950 [Paracoccus sp. SCSIO 75233]
MSDAPDHLPVGDLLRNAAQILRAGAADAHKLQLHLAAVMEAEQRHRGVAADVALLQSLDRMTQILDDLAVALGLAAGSEIQGRVMGWQEILHHLRLRHVAQTLSSGSTDHGKGGQIEIF